jgi:hypothetical protein
VQRCTERRRNHVLDHRLRYRDVRLPPGETVRLGGMPVANRVRTLCDLVRADVAEGRSPGPAAIAMAQTFPDLALEARRSLAAGGPVPFKRQALAWLQTAIVGTARQDDVTR